MARRAKEKGRISDELLAGEDPAEAFRNGELLSEMKKAVAERALNAEMDHHLSREPERQSGNHRNGHNRKRVATESGSMDLSAPRDRRGSFEPALVEKHVRRLPGFDGKVISMCARGMTTREIAAHVEELCGLSVSRELVSKVTDAAREEIRQWQSRPLEPTCAIVCFDAVRVKIRDEGLVRNKAAHLAVGVTCAGRKEVLGMWLAREEGAKFWLSVMNELGSRGVQDVLIAVVDGLKGFPEAIEAVFPDAVAQTCIVHLMRCSLAHAAWKERRELAAAIRPVHQAPTAEAAAALDGLEAGPWNGKYPAIARSWRAAWDRVVPSFAFSAAIRRAVHATNAIESLNSTVRRAVRAHGHFPSDRAAAKLVFLALRNVAAKWRNPPQFRHAARAELAIRFGERFLLVEQ